MVEEEAQRGVSMLQRSPMMITREYAVGYRDWRDEGVPRDCLPWRCDSE